MNSSRKQAHEFVSAQRNRRVPHTFVGEVMLLHLRDSLPGASERCRNLRASIRNTIRPADVSNFGR